MQLVATTPASARLAPHGTYIAADPNAGRGTYVQTARQEMQVWDRQMHVLSSHATAAGKAVGKAAQRDLTKAWIKAETAASKLQTASAKGWLLARAGFESASRDLSVTWHRYRGAATWRRGMPTANRHARDNQHVPSHRRGFPIDVLDRWNVH